MSALKNAGPAPRALLTLKNHFGLLATPMEWLHSENRLTFAKVALWAIWAAIYEGLPGEIGPEGEIRNVKRSLWRTEPIWGEVHRSMR